MGSILIFPYFPILVSVPEIHRNPFWHLSPKSIFVMILTDVSTMEIVKDES